MTEMVATESLPNGHFPTFEVIVAFQKITYQVAKEQVHCYIHQILN